MAVTTNTLLPLMAVGSLGKETIYNDALALLDVLVSGYDALSVAGGANVTLTEAFARNPVIKFTGILSANIAVIFPSRDKQGILILNATTGAYSLTVRTAAGVGPSIPQGSYVWVFSDGIDMIQAGPCVGAGHLALKSGTAQTAAADTVSLWEADTAGVAGKGGLHIMTEDGTQHVLGDEVGLGTLAPEGMLHVVGPDATSTSIVLEAYTTSVTGPFFSQRRARGTLASPAFLNVADSMCNMVGSAYTRNAGDTADIFQSMGRIRILVESKDAQGRMGGYIEFSVSAGVSATVAEKMRLSEIGNLLLGATSFGTSLAKGFVLGNGTAPSTSPADMTQLWSADRDGVAGKAGLHIRSETGTEHVLADGVRLNRLSNGQGLSFPEPLTELLTVAAAATSTTTIQIPANAVVLGVSVRVTTVIPTATTFDIGIGGATTRYGTGLSTAATTTNPGTNDGVRYYAAATAIVVTPNLTPGANTGRLRITIHYYTVVAATS